MTDAHLPADHEDGAYWRGVLADEEDQILHEPIPETPSIEIVSRMLGDIRRLQRRVADYEQLHMIEVDRLARRRAEVTGPLLQRAAKLEDACQQFAAAAFRDFGKTTYQTPNGVIKVGRPVVAKLTVVDDMIADWARAMHPAAVIDKPTVVVAELRALLDTYEKEAGTIERRVRVPGYPEALPLSADIFHGGRWEDDWVGLYWSIPDDARLAGVTWKPTGDQGLGRHITVTAA